MHYRLGLAARGKLMETRSMASWRRSFHICGLSIMVAVLSVCPGPAEEPGRPQNHDVDDRLVEIQKVLDETTLDLPRSSEALPLTKALAVLQAQLPKEKK